MDSKLSVQHGHQHHNGISKPPVHSRKGGRHQHGGGKGIKVVYISSPMKLTASAKEFRAVVQELTGRDSNVADHDLAAGAYSYSSVSSYSSFGRISPTGSAGSAVGARAPSSSSPTTTTATTASVGTGRAVEYGAAMAAAPPPPFQSMYDQTAGSLLYGQDYISW
ncbi:hypothetical protein HU200_016502 [Digitaria exilis]|uniref:VQ domain-containing protein n=1 Tax=Digitaria exilis TaxID=1010633 RepID=A0A835F803_9POAL|nr:hypothetical protein HU200_016502 [Digitaria exilis]